MLRTLLAPNPSAMTLDGTRTFIVGERRIAIIDPGPDNAAHLDAIRAAAGDADAVIVLTHQHPDHAAGAERLATMLDAEIRSHAGGTLDEGDEVPTDAGALHALLTPGHTRDHVSLHWPDQSAIFVGDLMMGGMDTALVATAEGGDLKEYLEPLERLRDLGPKVLYPAHGPEFTDPDTALAQYRDHRLDRLAQVRAALAAGVRHRDDLVDAVYGNAVPPELRAWTRSTLEAYIRYLGVEVG